MAQDTLLKKQVAVIQGRDKHRHLALTAVIILDNTPSGIILASLDYSFLQKTLNSPLLGNNQFELKQRKTSIAKSTNTSVDGLLDKQLKIPLTSWSLHYRSAIPEGATVSPLNIAIILLPTLIIGLALFVAYRNLSNTLRQDLTTILKAIKDLFSGKTIGSYPLKINELQYLISSMVQFKRVLDHGGSELANELTSSTDSDDFFDEPEGISFLEMEDDAISKEHSTQMQGSPISFPVDGAEPTKPPTNITTTTTQPTSVAPNSSSIYRAYDIRGIANKTLTNDIVHDLGKAIGSEAKEQNISTIVLGRDGRLSSESFSDALAQGVISTGVNIVDIGLAPSPLVYFVAHHTEGRSAVVITASHNPAEYNGLKVIINGESLAGEKIQQLQQRVTDKNFISDATGSISQNTMFPNEYIGLISEDIHLVRPMKVAIDCGNGAAGELAPTLLKTLGCDVIELFCDIDGTFPNHHPDPSNPDNLQDLIAAVQHYKADIGLAFDGDGDRLGVVDSNGKIIWPDRLLMLFAKDVLANKPGAEIIYDVKSSHHLEGYISKLGGRSLMWKTGHSFIKSKIKETGAALAGEMSGHIFFNDRWFGFDDAIYSAARLIGILSDDTRDSADVFDEIPESTSTPEINIPLAEGEGAEIMKKLLVKASFKEATLVTIDGLRVNFTDGWGLVRASNTMPALALRFEANDTAALARIQAEFKALLLQIKPTMDVPF